MDLVLLFLLGLCGLAPVLVQSKAVFLDEERAHKVLRSGLGSGPGLSSGPGPSLVRSRRHNSGWFEELQRGDLRRECVEEICSYEEAREVFEHTEITNEFWKTYRVQDHCSSGPCLNGGTCVDLGPDQTPDQGSSFTCLCPPGSSGHTCQLDDQAARRRCLVDNGGCAHFCEEAGLPVGAGSRCSCALGYQLDQDQTSCTSVGPIGCGTVPVLQNRTGPGPGLDPRGRIVGGDECPRGECPWTVLLRSQGRPFCGAVFLSPDWVLTAAHCLEDTDRRHLEAVAGEHDVQEWEGSEQVVSVAEVHVHAHYDPLTVDNDIALLRVTPPLSVTSHAVPACLPTRAHVHTQVYAKSAHVVSGWGRVHEAGPASSILKRLTVPLVRSELCQIQSGLSLSGNMLCAGWAGGGQDSCKGDSGGPLVTQTSGTWFLTGIVSWGKGCARPGQYGVYTRVQNYLDWIWTKTGLRPDSQDQKQDQNQTTSAQDQTDHTENQVFNQTGLGLDQDLSHNETRAQTRSGPGLD
ncbi:unnamed protein product [Knipowitschia caucasica]